MVLSKFSQSGASFGLQPPGESQCVVTCRQEILKYNQVNNSQDLMTSMIDLDTYQNSQKWDEPDKPCEALDLSQKFFQIVLENATEHLGKKSTIPDFELVQAAAVGNINKVKELIVSGIPVDCKADDGYTALMVAVNEDHVKVVSYLLEIGANVNIKCSNGKSALAYATTKETVELLLKYKCEIDTNDENGNTPLFINCMGGKLQNVELLVKAGADINHLNTTGRTALMAAAEGGFIEIVELLLKEKAKVGLSSYHGMTAILYAFLNDHTDVVKILQKHQSVLIPENKSTLGRSLIFAAAKGNSKKVRELIKMGANVNFVDENGNTAVIVASQSENPDTIHILLQHGANCNAKNEEGKNALMVSSLRGHYEIVKSLLECGADANIKDMNDRTPVLTAAQNGNLKIIQLLHVNGGELNCELKNGINALYLAAVNSRLETVKWLLQQNINVNIANDNGHTPVQICSLNGKKDIAQLLCDANADVNYCDSKGRTPLMAAAQNGHISTMDMLVKYGADISIADSNGLTALGFAANNNHKGCIQYLLTKYPTKNRDDGMALMYCAFEGDFKSVKLLLELNIPVDHVDLEGRTPLMAASQKGHLDIVTILTKHGANINKKSKYDTTALTHAIVSKRYTVVDFLLQNKADCNTVDIIEMTPLLCCCYQNDCRLVSSLLKNGADPNKADPTGDTPLMVACTKGSMDMVKNLIDSDANVYHKNNMNIDAVTLAYKNGYDDIVDLLSSCNAYLNEEVKTECTEKLVTYLQVPDGLIQAIAHGELGIAKKVLCYGGSDVDVNHVDEEGFTALQIACRRNSVEMVQHLIEYGAEIEYAPQDGVKPLMIAACLQKLEVLHCLIEYGANIDGENNEGDTALAMCIRNGKKDIVELLLQKGAAVDHQGQTKCTPLMAAAKNGELDMVKLLLVNGAKLEMKNINGLTAREYAEMNKHEETKQLLDDYSKYYELKKLIDMGNISQIHGLLASGFNVNFYLFDQPTLLHEAVNHGKIDMMKILLDAGADVNVQYPLTPITVAMKSQNLKALELLLHHGAIIDFASIDVIDVSEAIDRLIKEFKQREHQSLHRSPEDSLKEAEPIKISSDEDKQLLKASFRQFLKQMGRQKIPDYIQHCTRSKKYMRIVVNIDKGSLSQANSFTKRSTSLKIYQLLHFVEQPNRPFPLMMKSLAGEGRENIIKTTSYLEAGCILSGIKGSNVPSLLNGPPVNSVQEAMQKHTGVFNYGSLGCYAKDQDDNVYGVTCKHIFDCKQSNTGMPKSGEDIVDSSDVHSISEVYVPAAIEQVEHFSDHMYAIYKCLEINGEEKMIDIAILRLTQNTLQSPHVKWHFTGEQQQPVLVHVCEMPDDDIIGHKVQKNGVTTKFTEGTIIDADYVYNINNEFHGGVFVIAAEEESQLGKFADIGDSGALVTAKLKSGQSNNAYGLCHCTQVGFVDDNGKQYLDVLFCPRLDHSFTAVSQIFRKEMILCNPQIVLPPHVPQNAPSVSQPENPDNMHDCQNEIAENSDQDIGNSDEVDGTPHTICASETDFLSVLDQKSNDGEDSDTCILEEMYSIRMKERTETRYHREDTDDSGVSSSASPAHQF